MFWVKKYNLFIFYFKAKNLPQVPSTETFVYRSEWGVNNAPVDTRTTQ